jgi:hypothetical protein
MSRLATAAIVTALAGGACRQNEGERCNPLLYSDVPDGGTGTGGCNTGLVCVYPANCGVAYCCPPIVTPASSPNCQPCPADAGTD